MTADPAEWRVERLSDLVAVVDAAMPEERLTAAELQACCIDDATVLGDDAGAVSVWRHPDLPHAVIKLLAVVPTAHGEGRGRRLLEAGLAWAADHGATSVGLGASPPRYLWPGVDVRATAMLALAEATGFVADGAVLNMACTTAFRAPVPERVRIERLVDGVDAVAAWVAEHWPHWEAELRMGAVKGGCHVAWDAAAAPVGFACHSVNRAGWFGPTATDPARRHEGIGAALLGACCADLEAAGHLTAEIAWIGPLGFYARAAGATVSRVFRTATLPIR